MNSQTPAEKLSEIDRDMEIIRKKLHALNRIVHNPKASAKDVFTAEGNVHKYNDMLSDLMLQRKDALEQMGRRNEKGG